LNQPTIPYQSTAGLASPFPGSKKFMKQIFTHLRLQPNKALQLTGHSTFQSIHGTIRH
jgi:hypothetical protein